MELSHRYWIAAELVLYLSIPLVLAHAQGAWVPPKGEGDYTIVFQDLYTKDHLLGDGSRVDIGHVTLVGLVQSVDFGVTDKLAVTLALPVGMGKYRGNSPHQLPIDDGNFHGTFQDLGLGVRYNFRRRPVLLTPFMWTSFPTNHYEHFAHSAIGSDAWELRFGLNAGHLFETGLPNTFFQVQYSYALAERFIGIRPNKSRANGEFGYFMTPRLSVRALALSQVTHGGLEFPRDFPHRTSGDPVWRQHDRIATVDVVNVGGGIGYSVTRNLDVFASLVTTVWGKNGHALHTGLTVGISRSFHTPWARTSSAMLQSETTDRWGGQVLNMPPQVQCSH